MTTLVSQMDDSPATGSGSDGAARWDDATLLGETLVDSVNDVAVAEGLGGSGATDVFDEIELLVTSGTAHSKHTGVTKTMERRVRHKKNSCEYANTLNTLHTNKLPLQAPGLLVPQTQNAYDYLDHLLYYDLEVGCAIHKTHTHTRYTIRVCIYNTHLEQWTVYSLIYVRILWTCVLRKHATCTHCGIHKTHMHKVCPTCRCVHVDCTGHLCPA